MDLKLWVVVHLHYTTQCRWSVIIEESTQINTYYKLGFEEKTLI